MLNQLIADAEERQVQLADAYAEQIGAILEVFLDALNLNSAPARKVLRELLRQAGSGSPLAVSPALAEPAREDVRRRVRMEVEAEMRREQRN